MAGRRGTRSKTGCLTCRIRRLKCDEIHPTCTRCTAQRFTCDWPPNHGRGKSTSLDASTQVSHLARPICAQSRPVTASLSAIKPSSRILKCANSVALTPQDRRSLEYFSSSAVYGAYGFGQWCALEYIVQVIAPSSSGVMHMVLALTASEMHKEGIQSQNPAVDRGLYHYNMALQYLRNCLERGGQESAEAMIAMIFFMVQYELQFSASVDRVRAHFEGLWAVISTHPLFQEEIESKRLPYPAEVKDNARVILSCQLLVWLLYADIMGTSSGASTSLLRRLSSSNRPILEPRHLYKTARAGASQVWGQKSPATAVLFDMEIHRVVEFGHRLLSIRFDIWDLRTRDERCIAKDLTPAPLLNRLHSLRKEYSDVLQVAETAPNIPWTQTIESVTRIAACYWSSIIFHRRMFDGLGPQNDSHRDAITKIANLLIILYEHQNEKTHARLAWPTFIVAIETDDPIRRKWLLEKLRNARGLSTECEWACSTAEEMVKLQTASGAQWADLAVYMQRQAK